MDLARNFSIFCVVFYAALCSAEENHFRTGEACITQYLKAKGKLNADFQSSGSPSSHCRLIIPLAVQMIKTNINDRVKKEIPNESDCLTEELDNQGTIDYLLKISVIGNNKLLSEIGRQTQLEETRSQFKADLENIAIQCETDDKNFINIFHDNLGIKNETLEAFQHQYCLTKYAMDNKFLELDNVEMNPHHIDLESVNCDYIVDVEKSKNEKELSDKLSSTPAGGRSSDCILKAFRSNKVFGWNVSLQVLNYLDVARETKEREMNRIGEKIGEYVLSSFSCVMSGIPGVGAVQ